MKNDLATPRPWTLSIINEPMGNHKTNRRVLYKIDQSPMPLDIHPEKEHLANAELIVRAVNNFDALLDALKSARDILIENRIIKSEVSLKIAEAIKNVEK